MANASAMLFAVAGGASLGLFAAGLTRLGGVPPRTMARVLLGSGALGAVVFDGQARAASLGILAAGSGQYATQKLDEAYQAAVKKKLAKAGELASGWLSALGGGK